MYSSREVETFGESFESYVGFMENPKLYLERVLSVLPVRFI